MDNKLDVFEILGVNNNTDKDQGQDYVSDLGLNDIRKYLDKGPVKNTMSGKAKKVSNPENELKPQVPVIAPKVNAPVSAPKPQVQVIASKPQVPKSAPVQHEPPKSQVPVSASKTQVPKSALVQHEPPKAKQSKKKLEKASRPKKKSFVKWVVLLAVVLLFFTFVVNISKVSTDSMSPLIGSGDKVIVSKVTKNYNAGDIIAFKDIYGKKHIARIVADDGDVVSIDPQGGLYLNNKLQEEEYTKGDTLITDEMVRYPIIVGENEFFVLGDNRAGSIDSRNSEIGLVTQDDIIGKVIYCLKGI